jgi:hypothetical protein
MLAYDHAVCPLCKHAAARHDGERRARGEGNRQGGDKWEGNSAG